jgi:hypothetical protein
MRGRYQARMVVNLVNGSTVAGVLVAVAGRTRLRTAPDGLLVAAGYRLPVPVAPAFCLGNVLVTRWPDEQFRGHTRLFAHEARHATQYAWCGGLPMLPLYGAAALVSWARCGDFGARNLFEQRAGLADGGYSPKPLRPGWPRVWLGCAGRARLRCAPGVVRAQPPRAGSQRQLMIPGAKGLATRAALRHLLAAGAWLGEAARGVE